MASKNPRGPFEHGIMWWGQCIAKNPPRIVHLLKNYMVGDDIHEHGFILDGDGKRTAAKQKIIGRVVKTHHDHVRRYLTIKRHEDTENVEPV